MTLFLMTLAFAAEPHSFDKGLDALRITSNAGAVTVTSGDRFEVVATEVKAEASCELSYATEGKVAVVTFESSKNKASCQMDFEIIAPAGIELHLTLGAGDVALSGLKGEVVLEIGAGDVDLDVAGVDLKLGAGEVTGTLTRDSDIKVGAGDVELTDLTHPVSVKTGAGGIELVYSKAPKGRVSAKVGVGSIDVELPAGTAVAKASDGGTFEVDIDDSSETVVDLKSGMGSVSVHP